MKARGAIGTTAMTAAGLALLVGGCSVGDEYQRPETEMPAAWAAPVPGAEAWPVADWWRRFGSAPLDRFMEQARTANFDLGAAMARVRQADAQARIAGAALVPALDLSTKADRQLQPNLQSSSSGSASKADPRSVFTAAINASYEIDFWGKNAAARDSALATARASRFDQQTVALTVQAGVATTWFEILGLQDRLAVARANVANAEEVLAAIRDRQRFGTATELDVAQQESVVAGLRAVPPPLEQQLRQDINALAVLIGTLPEKVAPGTGSLADITLPPVAPGLPSELLTRRPDVRFAEAQLIAANADMAQAKAALFPSVNLTVEYGFESLALATLLHGSNTLYSLAAGLTQPIFHGGALRGGMELKEARTEELLQTYRKAVVSAFSDVENALIAAEQATREVEAQQVSETTARRAFEIAQEQLRAGIVDITTVLNTQKTLFTAQDSLAQARLTRLQAMVGLYKALGGGWRTGAEKS